MHGSLKHAILNILPIVWVTLLAKVIFPRLFRSKDSRKKTTKKKRQDNKTSASRVQPRKMA